MGRKLPPDCARAVHLQAADIVSRLLVRALPCCSLFLSHPLLQAADASQSAGASLKSLTLAPGIRAKSATHAVCCETLKHLSLLQALALEAGLTVEPSAKRQRVEGGERPAASHALTWVLVYELLFGGGCAAEDGNETERAVCGAESALRAGLARRLQEAGASEAHQLLPASMLAASAALAAHPRCCRVNTLLCSVSSAVEQLRASLPHASVDHDALLPDCLTLPPSTDLHAHPLVAGGQLVLQGRGSCMAAHALAPLPGWLVVDACAAPGNKTTHLAALMQGRGTVVAFDADQARLLRLKAAVTRAGASRVIQPRLADFLAQSHAHPPLSSAQALLLDPSCSGSGTRLSRGDALLPSAGDRGGAGAQRVAALSRFQLAALRHALRAPALRRLVYSTCSLDAVENERVVAQALSEAELLGWRLCAALPDWPRRGLRDQGLDAQQAACLVRTDPMLDGCDGFFLALFTREEPPAQEAAREKVPPPPPPPREVRWAGAQGGGGKGKRRPLFK